MKHSIIIPHRNRATELERCLRSLNLSAGGSQPIEVVIVGMTGMSSPLIICNGTFQVLPEPKSGGMFNKAACLNAGIEVATGDVLTFLDCDMIVGSCWLGGVEEFIRRPELTLISYRVRSLPVPMPRHTRAVLAAIDRSQRHQPPASFPGELTRALPPNWEKWVSDHAAKFPELTAKFWSHLFARYDAKGADGKSALWCRGYEARRTPDEGWPAEDSTAEPAFGNSQFSIRRETLGDLRFDEQYVGRGFEDLDMIQQIWQRHKDHYCGHIFTDSDHALLHVLHEYTRNWLTVEATAAACNRYRAKWQVRQEDPRQTIGANRNEKAEDETSVDDRQSQEVSRVHQRPGSAHVPRGAD
jgi:hypothetical protein